MDVDSQQGRETQEMETPLYHMSFKGVYVCSPPINAMPNRRNRTQMQ